MFGHMRLSVSFDLIPYLQQMNVKKQSSRYLTDSGSHQKSCTKSCPIQTAGVSLTQDTVGINQRSSILVFVSVTRLTYRADVAISYVHSYA